MATKGPGRPDHVQSAAAAALYIRALVEELATIARGHRFEALAYILDMARLEADEIAKSSAEAGGANS